MNFFVLAAHLIQGLICAGYAILQLEARISDFFELYIWRFFLGPLADTQTFQEWGPWTLERFSTIGVLWAMNLWIQWIYRWVDRKVPKHTVVDYVPEFTPPNITVSVMRHVYEHNPITFAIRQAKRLILWIKIWYHCHNMAYVSQEIEKVITRLPDCRRDFLKFGAKIPIFKNAKDHSHPVSASYRSAVNEYMKDVAITAGYTPYSVSKSIHDQEGNRFFYGVKDLGQVAANDPVPDTAALIFTDVDYYADMRHWMLLNKPIMMYTFSPSTLAGTTDEYSFRTIGDYVEYRVSGGAVYRHMIWDYKGDCMTVCDPSSGEVLTFSVEQRTIEGDPDHRIVLLLPVARVPYPHCLYLTGHTPLQRKKYGVGEYRHMFDPLTKVLSLATDGAYSSVEISVDIYNAIRERIKAKSGLPLVSDVEKYLSQQQDVDAVLKAPLLFSLMDTEFKPNVVSTSMVGVSYQPFSPKHKAELVSGDGKPKGRAVSQPLLAKPAVMPTKSISSDISSVEGRVNRPRNNRDPPSYLKHLKGEFVRVLIGKLASTGSSISTEEVQLKQDKPGQKARFENSKHYLSEQVVGCLKTFIKAEGYAAPNDPRTITQVPPEVTTLMSEYTYAFKEAVLKTQPWYGPGKTPAETIDRLSYLTTRSGVITTDFTRFDGSISEFLQSVAKSCYMLFFTPNDRRRLGNLFKAVFVKTAFTECGFKYDAGVGTRSGSPITTDANTIINAFIMYCALRRLGMSISEAMANIGLACGDDGYMKNRPGLREALVEVCLDLGLELKPEEHTKGPYPYLGRYFCDPATTDSSFQDPMRTLAKIHISANSQVSESQARVNKSLGYLSTDALTPLISQYCRLNVMFTDGDDPKTDYGGKSFTNEEAFKQTLAWPQEPNDKDLIFQQVADLCGLEALELRKMCDIIDGCNSYKEVPVLFDNDRVTKVTAAVDGDLEYPKGRVLVTPELEQEPRNEPKSTTVESSHRQTPTENRKGNLETGGRPQEQDPSTKPFKRNGRPWQNKSKPGGSKPEGVCSNQSLTWRGGRNGDAPPSRPDDKPSKPAKAQSPTRAQPRDRRPHGATGEVAQAPKVKGVQRHGLGSGRKCN